MFGDTVFIRICLILAQVLIFVWTTCGTPEWPYLVNVESIQFHIDTFMWCSLCIIVAAVPLYHQLSYKDSEIDLDCGRMTHMAEAMWRDWFRRSGIPRADFKKVLDCGEWLEVPPGSNLSMFAPETSMAETTSNSRSTMTYGDVYYYVMDGCLECKSFYKEGERTFTARPGSFIDAMNLIAFLGQPTAALAMQLGPLDVKVALTSTFSLVVPVADDREAGSHSDREGGSPSSTPPPINSPLGSPTLGGAGRNMLLQRRPSAGQLRRSQSAEFAMKGALVLRFRRQDLLEQVLCAQGLASSALKLVVSQSTLDNLFCESIRACQPALRRRYDVIHDMRRRLNNSPLPLDAADLKISLWEQWWKAHASLRDFWRPGPEQRAMNAIRLATQEKDQMDELRVHEAELERLRCVRTPFSSPYGSRTSLNAMAPSRSSSRDGMSSGSSSPVQSSMPDTILVPVSSIGSNLATLGEEPGDFSRHTSGDSLVLRQDESSTPKHDVNR